MMNTRQAAAKAFLLCAMLAVFGSCGDPWRGEDDGEKGTVAIIIRASENRAAIGYPPEENLGQIEHLVNFIPVDPGPAGTYIPKPMDSGDVWITQHIIPAGETSDFVPIEPGLYSIKVTGKWYGKSYSFYTMPPTQVVEVFANRTTQAGPFQMTMDTSFEEYLGYIPIKSAEELKTLADQSDLENFPLDGNYLVVADSIDLSVYGSWTPIGDDRNNDNSSAFMGTFDGNGKNITGLKIPSGGNLQGLFGWIIDAEVKNVNLIGVDITSSGNVGGIAGLMDDGEINNCFVSGSIRNTGTPQTTYVGGVVGYNNAGTITRCRSEADVTGGWVAGGVAGRNNGGTISYCSSTGNNVNGTHVGGVVGENMGVIHYSFATGNVEGGGTVGGVVGSNSAVAGTELSDCYYAVGTVTALSDPQSVGGVVGMNTGPVKNCYAAGTVILDTDASQFRYIGGVAGGNSGTVENCVALNESLSVPTGHSNFGRVAGDLNTLINNYGKADMTLTQGGINVPSSWGNETADKDGEDVSEYGDDGPDDDTLKGYHDAQWWRDLGYTASAWVLEDGQFPTIAIVDIGTPPAPPPGP